jgi:hypothetical protein
MAIPGNFSSAMVCGLHCRVARVRNATTTVHLLVHRNVWYVKNLVRKSTYLVVHVFRKLVDVGGMQRN